jgi:hypothetical protein
VPALQFNNIPLGIAHITKREFAGAGNIERDELAVIASTLRQDFGALYFDVGNFECEMRETGACNLRRERSVSIGILKNFQSRPALAVAGQAQVAALRASIWPRGESFELFTMMIAFAADGHAIEKALIKIGELAPILGDEVCVRVTNLAHGASVRRGREFPIAKTLNNN